MKHGDKQTHLLPAFHSFCCTHNLLSLAKLQAPTPKTKNLHFRSDSSQTQSAIQDSQSCAASSSSFATRRGPLVLGGDSALVSGRRFFGVTCAGFSCPSGAAGFDEPRLLLAFLHKVFNSFMDIWAISWHKALDAQEEICCSCRYVETQLTLKHAMQLCNEESVGSTLIHTRCDPVLVFRIGHNICGGDSASELDSVLWPDFARHWLR